MARSSLAAQEWKGLFAKLYLGSNSTAATTQYASANLKEVTLNYEPKFVDVSDMDDVATREVLSTYSWNANAVKGVVSADFKDAIDSGDEVFYAEFYAPGSSAATPGAKLASGLVNLGKYSITIKYGEAVVENLELRGTGPITWG